MLGVHGVSIVKIARMSSSIHCHKLSTSYNVSEPIVEMTEGSPGVDMKLEGIVEMKSNESSDGTEGWEEEECERSKELVGKLNPPNMSSALQYGLSDLCRLKEAWDAFPFVYRINDGYSTNNILQRVCEERGWKEYEENNISHPSQMSKKLWKDAAVINSRMREGYWNIWWRCVPLSAFIDLPAYSIYQWQYMNHCPKNFMFSNKNTLCSFIRKMRNNYGEIYNFVPTTYILPNELRNFIEDHDRRILVYYSEYEKLRERLDGLKNPFDKMKLLQQKGVPNKPVWISKPIGKSQGKGIYISIDINALTQDHDLNCELSNSNPTTLSAHQSANIIHGIVKPKTVVQEYIIRPLLVGGYKCDIRLYVCIPSTNPLSIYLYREGLTRFATKKYDMSDLTCLYAHLTNASLNKLSPEYETDKDLIGYGCKWTLRQLRQHLAKENRHDWLMWQRIMCIVVLTVVGEIYKTGPYPQIGRCFDFFGFDILIDENMKPWLLEVNFSPGLGGNCEIDELVKKPMLNELFDLLGLPDCSYLNKLMHDYEEALNSISRETKNSNVGKAQSQNKSTSKPPPQSEETTGKLSKSFIEISEATLLKAYAAKQPQRKKACRMKEIKARYAEEKLGIVRPVSSKSHKSQLNISTKCSNTAATNQTSESDVDCYLRLTTIPIQSRLEEFIKLLRDKRMEDQINEFFYKTWGGIWCEKRNWNNAPNQHGNWIKVYPYERGSKIIQPTASGFNTLQLRNLVQTMRIYLEVAESIFKTNPGESDQFYREAVATHLNHGTEIWIPPC